METKETYQSLLNQIDIKIKEFDTIIIHRHTRPDGDAIGSSLGLREVLRLNFPNKKVYCPNLGIPKYLEFAGTEDDIEDSIYENALVIVVDTASSNRICGDNYKKAKYIIKIDHHIPTDHYGDINYVKEEYGSCSLVLMEMFKELGYTVDSTSARLLYIATITDTGRFRFKEVDGKALKLAGEMLEYGVDTQQIYANLYTDEKQMLALKGYVYSHIKYTKNGVSYLFMTERIRKKFKVSLEDASNCVSLMDCIRGSMIWLLFIELDGEVRVRLRSRFIPIDKLANKYHGGGHENACGATVYTKKERLAILEDADLLLKEFKEKNEDKF